MPNYPDSLIKSILRSVRTIAMVGASTNEIRPSYFAMMYLLNKGYKVIPVNPGAAGPRRFDLIALQPNGHCLRNFCRA